MPPKWGIIGVVSRENPFDPLTNAPKVGYNRGSDVEGLTLPHGNETICWGSVVAADWFSSG
jgi:hypothetical protein